MRSTWSHHRGDLVIFNDYPYAVGGDEVCLEGRTYLEYYNGDYWANAFTTDSFPINGLFTDFSSLVVPGRYATSSDILYIYYVKYDAVFMWVSP